MKDAAGPGSVASLPERRSVPRAIWALLAAATAGVVLAGAWGITASRGDESGHGEELASVGDLVSVPGGLLRLDQVADTSLAHRMAGMDFYGQQEQGKRRVTLRLTLFATGRDPIPVAPEAFELTGKGVAPIGPFEADLGSRAVPPDSRVSFDLSYQVPEELRSLVLAAPDAETRIAVTLGAAEPAGHADDH